MIRPKSANTGFTLVEIVVSVGLLAVLGLGVNTYLISSLRSARKAATSAIVKSEGEQIQTNIIQTVSFAKRIYECTNTSLSLLASDGTDVTYSITGGRLNQLRVPPNPTPTVSINMNSTKVSVGNGGDCGGSAFSCTTGGRMVGLCLTVTTTGIDVTETGAMVFKSQVYTNNN